jgi:hypothetical protein
MSPKAFREIFCLQRLREWIPPPNLDTGQARVNNYRNPERYLIPDEQDTEDGDGEDADC